MATAQGFETAVDVDGTAMSYLAAALDGGILLYERDVIEYARGHGTGLRSVEVRGEDTLRQLAALCTAVAESMSRPTENAFEMAPSEIVAYAQAERDREAWRSWLVSLE